MLITEIGGQVSTFAKQKDVAEADLVVDLTKLHPGDGLSLWSATLHPDFAKNRQMYVCYLCPTGGPHNRLSRFKLTSNAAPRVVPNSEEVLLSWHYGPHSAGCLLFGTDGMLYISTGDGFGPNPPDGLTTGQDISDLLGGILRIDVDHTSGDLPYAIPADNPFVNTKGARGEIWAYGLRNPWKFGIDRQTGDIFAADNGWESWEMIHKIVPGGNCGWPVMEGRAALRTEVKVGPTPIRPPVKDHPHSEANSVIGGPVYRGKKLPALDGSFVYGDYITGTIWALRPDADNAYSHTTLVDTDQRIVGFAEGSQGELYVLDFDYTGQIYELLPSGEKDTSAEFPRRLSETGLFASLASLQPAAGVVPYEVTVNRWLDGAEAKRWIAIPGTGQATLSAEGHTSKYPDGTVLVKHIELPQSAGEPIRLETQLLHFENGTWRPYSYLWDEAGKDATLVDSIGADRAVQPDNGPERTWHASALNECRLCHNAGSGFVLGFVPNQLDKADQLAALMQQNVITKTEKLAADSPSRLVNPHDDSHPLNDRARSYLHGNCSMCHHPGGNAIISFYLRRELPFEKLNTNKGTRIGTFGMENAKVIAPGDPYRSILTYRMAKLGYGRMPYIGSYAVDSDGIALVAEWIRSLDENPEGPNSPPLVKGSPTAKALKTLANAKDENAAKSALGTLVGSTEGSLALIERMHGGSVKGQTFDLAVALGNSAARTDVQGLFETFLPEAKRRKRLGPHAQPEMILSLTGDAGRGKLIYFSDAGRCRACHDFTDPAKSLGPTLAEINKKYPRPAEMVQHVLQPSAKVEDKFAAYTAVTTQGRVVTGLVLVNNDQHVQLRTQENKIVTIPRDELDELVKSTKSLMPDQILSDLTAQEAADLLEYVRAVAPAPESGAGSGGK